jgi:purine-nucleoside phosphorylase
MPIRHGLPESFCLSKYGISESDIVINTIGCSPEAINENVIIAPFWEPDIYKDYVDSIVEIVKDKVFEITYQDKKITYIRSGIGAPQTGETILALGCTKCKQIIFTGSVGGLSEDQEIGHFIVPKYSISGDGYSKYLNGSLWNHEEFKAAYPNKELSSKIMEAATNELYETEIKLSAESIFSTDAIIAQFMYIDQIKEKFGCKGIEMETTAVFTASTILGIRTAALLQISDVCVNKKSLYSGRTEKDQERRKMIRKTKVPKIVLGSF